MSLKNKFRKFLFGPERGFLGKVDSSYLNGIRIITLGGVVALFGAVIIAVGLNKVGVGVLIAGITVGVAGFILHVIMVVLAVVKKPNDGESSNGSE